MFRGQIQMMTEGKQIEIRKLIEKRSIYHAFQPIYNLSQWNLYGFEALLRCADYNPETMFQNALSEGSLFELDTFSISEAVLSFFRSPNYNSLLFINAFPSTLIHPHFLEKMAQLIQLNPINPKRIIIEINESEIENFDLLQSNVTELRNMGFRFALDDVGKGIVKLSEFTELNPEIVKIDKSFSFELSLSQNKQTTIQRLIDFCNNDIQLVLEGIEKAEDLAMAKSLGVPFAQGFILGRPNDLESF
jgi:EAL domain-containing protein (putative c-di-GMP-specific phosphodiesterase class I)